MGSFRYPLKSPTKLTWIIQRRDFRATRNTHSTQEVLTPASPTGNWACRCTFWLPMIPYGGIYSDIYILTEIIATFTIGRNMKFQGCLKFTIHHYTSVYINGFDVAWLYIVRTVGWLAQPVEDRILRAKDLVIRIQCGAKAASKCNTLVNLVRDTSPKLWECFDHKSMVRSRFFRPKNNLNTHIWFI